MHEYSVKAVPITRHRDGHDLAEDYQAIITARAAEGWRFVQAIPFEHHREPRIDLVFTRKARKRKGIDS